LPNDPGIPRAMVLTVSFVVSLVIGLCATIPGATRERCRRVDTSVEISERHDFAVRPIAARQSARRRPPHPAPNVRDDRETPL
jgi:hypothetical protein